MKSMMDISRIQESTSIIRASIALLFNYLLGFFTNFGFFLLISLAVVLLVLEFVIQAAVPIKISL